MPMRPSVEASNEPRSRAQSAGSAVPSSRASSAPPQGSPSRPIASRPVSEAPSPASRGRQFVARFATASPAASVARSASLPAVDAAQHSATALDKGKGPAKGPPSGTSSPARSPSVGSARSAEGTLKPADPNSLVAPGEEVVKVEAHWFSVKMEPKQSMKARTVRQGKYIYPKRCGWPKHPSLLRFYLTEMVIIRTQMPLLASLASMGL
jgi:hypothetical protein